MNASSAWFGVLCIVLLGFLAACATEEKATQSTHASPTVRTSSPASAESKPATTDTKPVPKSLDTVSDSLNACLARIPKDSSPGARMMAENSCRRDEAIRAGTARSNDVASSGAYDDSLQACMARIPKDATVGQRMLAEQSCKRDEAARR